MKRYSYAKYYTVSVSMQMISGQIFNTVLITPRACARGKVIGRVVVVVVVIVVIVSRKIAISRDLGT